MKTHMISVVGSLFKKKTGSRNKMQLPIQRVKHKTSPLGHQELMGLPGQYLCWLRELTAARSLCHCLAVSFPVHKLWSFVPHENSPQDIHDSCKDKGLCSSGAGSQTAPQEVTLLACSAWELLSVARDALKMEPPAQGRASEPAATLPWKF